jgi:uncharacterized membrane protein
MIPFCFTRIHHALWTLAIVVATLGLTQRAYADLRLCNMTASRVGVTIGYREATTWTTEGWWTLKAKSCETLIKGRLSSRYIYVYAQDYDRGGEWAGTTPMCSKDKEFTIKGVEDCLARGFERTMYFEVDTGDQKDWTIQLADPVGAVIPK